MSECESSAQMQEHMRQQIKDLEAKLAAVTEELRQEKEAHAVTENKREHSVYWYGTRFERLRDWAKGLGDKLNHEFHNIVANGSVSPSEPHEYAQAYNTIKYRAEQAEKSLAEAREELGRAKEYAKTENWARTAMEKSFQDARKDLAAQTALVAELRKALELIRRETISRDNADKESRSPFRGVFLVADSALALTPATASAQVEQRIRADALRKAGDWFKAWKDMPADYVRAGDALYRMADEAERKTDA